MKKALIIISLISLFAVTLQAQNSLPQRTSFETDFGVWQQATTDDLDWIRWSGSTPTQYTGPDTAYDGQYYIYVEADPDNWNPPRNAALVGFFDFSSVQVPMLSFYYYMYGEFVNYLTVKISTDSAHWSTLTTIIGNQGTQWYHQLVCLGDYAGNDSVYIVFEAWTSDDTSSFGDRCDIALDKIEIVDFGLADSSHTDVTCGGYGDGTINLTVYGGFPKYRYSIDGGTNWTDYTTDTSITFDSLSGGTYLIKIESASKCYLNPGVITVYEPPTPDVTIDTQYVYPCVYSHNGAIKVVASNGNGPFTYSIYGSGGPFSSDTLYTNLDTGGYNVVVKDNYGCLFDQGIIRIDPYYEIKYLGYEKQDVSTCYGDANGSITINATGGHQPLEYSIDTGNTFTNSYYFSDLKAGDYFVIIQDQSGCRDTTDTITILQPPQLVINNITKYDVQGCYGDSTGRIIISASGGSGPLSYSINNGSNYYPDNEFDSLGAGQYLVMVKDTNNCTAGPDTVVINQPPDLVIDSINKTDITRCYGDSTGTIEIFASGGTPSLYYSIDSGKTYQLLTTFNNLGAGTYYPVVKDAAGCTEYGKSIEITQPPQLVLNSYEKKDVGTCYGDSTGQIILYATGGTSPLYYSIDSGATEQTSNIFDNLPAGTYYPKITDTNGCFVYGDSIVLTQPPQIIITEQTSTDVICNGDKTGTIYVNATGGTAPLLYSIDGGASYPYKIGTTVNVYAGTYNISVQDVNGCEVAGSTLVVNEPPKLLIDTVYKQDVNTCYGDSTGWIAIVATGGTQPYLYSIDYGSTFQSDSLFDSLPAGTNYQPLVKDAHNCFADYNTISIYQPSLLNFTSVEKTDIDTCHGVPVGTITINVAGGTPPYQYSIDSGTTFAPNNQFENLYAGKYYITVKDDHNCQKWYTAPITIYQPDTLILDSIVKKDISCYGIQDGNATIYAHGGEPSLTYILINGTDSLSQYANYFQSLGPGNYSIVVKDAYNCQVKDSFTIIEPPQLVLDTVLYTDVQTCYGDTTASITVVAYGGTQPLQYAYYKLNYGQSEFQTDSVFTGLSAGSYYVIVKDAHGCSQYSPSFTITQPTPVDIDSSGYEVISCYGANDGLIWIVASGGQNDFRYSIDGGNTWSSDSVFTNLGPGTYTLTVEDINGCRALNTNIITLNEPDSLYIDTVYIYDVSCYGYTDGQIKVLAVGGTTPLRYSLDSVTYQDDNDFYNLAPGIYNVYVVDDHGCRASQHNIEVHDQPNYAEFTATPTEGCSPLTVEFSVTNPNAFFSWYYGDSTSVGSGPNPTHTYYNSEEEFKTFTVKLIARHDYCIDSSETTITLYPVPQIRVRIDSTVNYYPDTIVGIYNETTQYEDFTWSFGDSTVEYVTQPLEHAYPGCGEYLLEVSARNYLGCYDTLRQTIVITAVDPEASFTVDNNEGCAPLTVNFYNTSSNAQTYIWDFGDGYTSSDINPTHIYTVGNNYMVRLKAYGYCGKSSVYEYPIYVYPTPVVDFYVDPDTASVGQNIGFFNQTQGGEYYIWEFGDGETSTDVNPRKAYTKPGIYSVKLTARSESGCVDSLIKDSVVYVVGDMLIRFPNAFTPDGDGINDYFKPIMKMVESAELYIFDRYGNIVFHTNHPESEFWDGTINGKPAPQDVYVWKITGRFINGQFFVKVGDVTLLR